MLRDLGANPLAERVVERGKILTAAGVSAGIDMALLLAQRLTDEITAQALQLMIEYDPQPPFGMTPHERASQKVLDRISEISAQRD